MRFFFAIIVVIFSFSAARADDKAANKLAGNFVFSVMPSGIDGEIFAVSQVENKSAINRVKIGLTGGELSVNEVNSFQCFDEKYSLAHNLILSDNTGKFKKSQWKQDNGKICMPYYETASGNFVNFICIQDGYSATTCNAPPNGAVLELDTVPELDTISGIPVAVNSTAKIGGDVFKAVLGLQSYYGVLLKNGAVVEMPNGEFAVSVAAFPINSNVQGLAVATYGNGILLSADTGKTWKNFMNRADVGGNLGSIRAIPSVLRGGGETSLIAYKVSKNSKITIEVFTYDMKKIRTVIKNAPRLADPVRSTDSKIDFWDGNDDSGRATSLGMYYVKVSDNRGNVGWGKIMRSGGK